MAHPIGILSLFSGSGYHDEAVRLALRVLGYDSRVLGYCEREAAAGAFLLGRMEAKALEPAPVFCGDMADMDARGFRGHCDIIVASPPCQPYSSAGRRRGNSDERSYGAERGPLESTLRIIDEARPTLVWFENVPEWVTGGHFRRFGEELSDLGYEVQDAIFLAAEDVGATIERERVFILAVAHEPRRRECFTRRRSQGRTAAGGSGAELAGTAGRRCGERRESSGGDGQPGGSDEELGIAGGEGREGTERRGASPDARTGARRPTGESGAAVGQPDDAGSRAGEAGEQAKTRLGRDGYADAGDRIRDFGIFPPARNNYRRWADLVTRGLEPARMPKVERRFSALAHGLAISDRDLLRLGGNGVVVPQAALAFIHALLRTNLIRD